MYPQHNFDPVPRKIEGLYSGRIRQFTDNGQYGALNLPAHYDRARTNGHENVQLESYSVPDLQRPLFKDAIDQAEWTKAKIGQSFGPSWSTHWFRIKVKLPKDWQAHEERPLFEWDSSDEGQVYLEDGTPLVGLSGEHNRREWTLPEEFLDGAWHTFYIETSCNDIQGNNTPPDNNRTFLLRTADLVLPRAAARALYIDFWIIGDASREIGSDHWQRGKALDVLNRIVNAFDRENVDASLVECRRIAAEYIGKVDTPAVYKEGGKTLASRNLIYAIGNCHIDTAWLWPFAETRRKVARSWASQLDLLERYPEYVFAASQTQQFFWLKQDHPDLFKRVQKAVKTGRFLTVGGAWVECDTNMPTGESLVRQTLLGQRFFEQHFGQRSKTFWLPDTFGYAPQLPQVCRLSGMDRFVTQKLSWNNINVFPNSTFNWVGLDGSQVVCHMPPANTYTAEAHFGDVRRSLTQNKNLDTCQTSLLLFGHGDGGGGPIAEMIEKLRRCRGLSDTAGELPRVHSGPTVDDFFDDVLESTHGGKSLVSWVGELYLEYHRGTYTTQARIKRGNRVGERLLHDLELLATWASLEAEYEYPFAEIEELWQDLLLCQFHDVLPGSGIRMIYEDAWKIHERVEKNGRKLVAKALKALGFGELGEVKLLQWQPRAANEGGEVEAYEDTSFDIKGLSLSPSPSNPPPVTLSNKHLKATFHNGSLLSLWDKRHHREVLSAPSSLKLFEDQPMNFPAWDTEQYATEKFRKLHGVSVLEGTSVVTHYRFGRSHVKIVASLTDQVEFSVEADWHETYEFLKFEAPVDVWSDSASYETAFGVHRRPTHYNTTWDVAKFELCAHRFADLSDWSYGVSLLSDSKYGYTVHGNTMRLSLLRAPKNPDPTADMGKHSFKFALRPHGGPLGPDTVRAAIEFNGLRYGGDREGGDDEAESSSKPPHSPHAPPPTPLPVHLVGSPNVFVSAVKRAEADRDAKKKHKSVIVRLYESLGGKGRVELVARQPLLKAVLVNNLEDELEELDVLSGDTDSVPLSLGAFEVKSVRLEFA